VKFWLGFDKTTFELQD